MIKKILKGSLVLVIATFLGCSEEEITEVTFGDITGKVVSRGDNTPIENAKISTNPGTNTVFTNANGEFVLSSLAAGNYSVEASKDELLTTFQGVTVISGTSVNAVFEMSTDDSNNSEPSSLTLVSPTDSSINNEINLTFEWSAIDVDEDPLIYSLEIRDGDTSEIVTYADISETTYTISDLKYNTNYFWQVSVNDGFNPDVLSEVRSFTTKAVPSGLALFVRNENGNDVIYSAEGLTSDDVIEQKLTSENMNSWRPRKTVVNSLVAFLRSVGGETHIFSMNADGSNINQVTSAVPVAGFNHKWIDFSWSVDGSKILYTNFDKLYQINTDGSGLNLVYQTVSGELITECTWNYDGTKIALKTNNTDGYGVSIFTIDMSGVIIDTVLSGVNGAAGGLDFSVDSSKLLYTYDVSGFESDNYRQLNTHIFIYDLVSAVSTDISLDKPSGFLDLDPRFSPNESEIIFTFTSNDGVSEKQVYKVNSSNTMLRDLYIPNANMPDWE